MFRKWTVLTKTLGVNIWKERWNMKGTDKKLEKEKNGLTSLLFLRILFLFLIGRPVRTPDGRKNCSGQRYTIQASWEKNDEQNNKHKRKILRHSFQFFSRTNGSLLIAVGYNESISVAWCKARSLSTLAWLLHSQSGKVKLRNNLQISASPSTSKVRTTLNNYIIHSGTEGNYKQIWETDAHKKISIQ